MIILLILLDRYYSQEWLNSGPNRLPPYSDPEISLERNKCLRRYFPNNDEFARVKDELSRFSGCCNEFSSFDSLRDRWTMDPKGWWLYHGSSVPLLQSIALKLLGQPSSSSCCERNWSTYSFIHSSLRNKNATTKSGGFSLCPFKLSSSF